MERLLIENVAFKAPWQDHVLQHMLMPTPLDEHDSSFTSGGPLMTVLMLRMGTLGFPVSSNWNLFYSRTFVTLNGKGWSSSSQRGQAHGQVGGKFGPGVITSFGSPITDTSSTCSSSSMSSEDSAPQTPSDTCSETSWASFSSTSSTRKRQSKRRHLRISVPKGRPLPEVEIDRSEELRLLKYNYQPLDPFRVPQSLLLTFAMGPWYELPLNDFIFLEPVNRIGQPPDVITVPQFSQLCPAKSTAIGPLALKFRMPSSEPFHSFITLSDYLLSRDCLDKSSKITSVDIRLAPFFNTAWTMDAAMPKQYTPFTSTKDFTHLVSFKWDGPLTLLNLPAPFYDFNHLPLHQMQEIVLKNCSLSVADCKSLLHASPTLERLEIDSIVADVEDDHCSELYEASQLLRLDCPRLLYLALSTSADLEEVFCTLDAPNLREIVYEPKGPAVEPVTLYNFPWNIMRDTLDILRVVSSPMDERVLEELERFSEFDGVRVEFGRGSDSEGAVCAKRTAQDSMPHA
ncbi:hypothetical protein FA15DRAFT_709274 [Coprinopsis marcescibilis]|uniref:F-box domain-containing protein n=1 Tax=Coprinopsis marcescibilis TaxID=230819 RepID=A0A5C3KTG4_COPMA|nr:hypothetical protein FA15DRAFT_709274 [Coprinopsis marcescibilis]